MTMNDRDSEFGADHGCGIPVKKRSRAITDKQPDFEAARYHVQNTGMQWTGDDKKDFQILTDILTALRIADRLQKGDVSFDMVTQTFLDGRGNKNPNVQNIFKAMSKQLIKEESE